MIKLHRKPLMGITLATLLSLTVPSLAQNNNSPDAPAGRTPSSVDESRSEPMSESMSENKPDSADTMPTGTARQEAKPAAPAKDFTIASWGGAYTQAQDKAYFTPYKKVSDLKLKVETHSGDFSAIKSRLSSSDWDVVDMSYNMVEKACKEGLIQKIDPSSLDNAPDGAPASEDFLQDGLHKCGIASMAWSSVILYNKTSFRKYAPRKAGDLFDTKRFRGKRALPKSAQYLLELALLADGVKPEDVYATLETPKGINQAFRKLNRIKRHIVWWSKPSQAFKLLNEKKASMGIAYNGRAFSAIAEQKKPFGIIWDGQIYDLNLWAIPKNSSYKKDALRFVAYATNPTRLADQASWFPYGPSRKSATSMIKPHPEAGINLKPYIPTMKNNFKRALRKDVLWWEKNGEKLNARFKRWIRNEPEPKPVAAVTIGESSNQTDVPQYEIKQEEPEQEEKKDDKKS